MATDRRWKWRLMAACGLAACVALGGCAAAPRAPRTTRSAEPTAPASAATTNVPASPTAVAPSPPQTPTVAPATTDAVAEPAESSDRGAGPSSALPSGRHVWLVIADSPQTKPEAEAALKELDAAFGAGGSGYTVEDSNRYAGVHGALWLVMRTFATEAEAQSEMERATRGRFEPFVQETVEP